MSVVGPGLRSQSRSGSETRKRAAKIDVRCDDDEKAIIQQAAAAAGLKPAAYLRLTGLERARATLAS
jgi:uncharacterized protein (DUF1778 family)